MGVNPDIDDYEAGGHCIDFELWFSLTETPKYIQATGSNIVACPPYAGPLPNMAQILTQSDPIHAPCLWVGLGGGMSWILTWPLEIDVRPIGGPAQDLFTGVGRSDSWNNLHVPCADPGHLATSEGKIQIAWGPGIGP